MAELVIDLVGLTGFASLCAGIWLMWGMPVALIVVGLMLLLWAVTKNKVRK